nr:MAG TPA: hypothetical protein [Caudoviricetes sp.]
MTSRHNCGKEVSMYLLHTSCYNLGKLRVCGKEQHNDN